MRTSARFLTATAIIAFAMLAMFATPSAYADTADGAIEVTATEPCAVEIVGVSENAGAYSTQGEVNGKAAFTITLDEPGTYEYVLRQVPLNGMEVYDSTEYNVWVTAYYDGDSMLATVTGGIKGTDDKPDAFKFEPPVKEPPKTQDEKKIEDQGETREPATVSETGDRNPIAAWSVAIAASTALLFLTGAARIVSRRRER